MVLFDGDDGGRKKGRSRHLGISNKMVCTPPFSALTAALIISSLVLPTEAGAPFSKSAATEACDSFFDEARLCYRLCYVMPKA